MFFFFFFTVRCEEVLTLGNGTIEFSNQNIIFSIATHICNATDGYVLTNPNITTRICQYDGWSGSEITCKS